jgi:RNA polymerase sigma-70 factor (ECF subfamily)
MKDTNDDLSLIQQVAELHDKTAFDRLVRKYQSPIRRFFLHQTLGDAQLSDDLAQDTFIRAYTSIGTFRGSAAFSTWLFRIAYNVFYDYRHRLRPSADDLDAARLTQLAPTGRSGWMSTVLSPVCPTLSAHASRYSSSTAIPSNASPQ